MRRALRLAATALALAAATAAAQNAVPVPITPAEEFPVCLARLRTLATGQGIRESVVNGALRSVEYDQTVVDSMTRQPEFQMQIWDYMAGLVDERRIVEGREHVARLEALLTRIERRYAVDRHVVLAIWGIESNYGKITGRRPLVRSLATASCFGLYMWR